MLGDKKSTLGVFQKACVLIGLGVFQICISPSVKCSLTFIYSTWDTLPRQECHVGQVLLEGKSAGARIVLLACIKFKTSSDFMLFKLFVIQYWEFPMVLREVLRYLNLSA